MQLICRGRSVRTSTSAHCWSVCVLSMKGAGREVGADVPTLALGNVEEVRALVDLEVLVTLRGEKKQGKSSPNDAAGRLTTLDSLVSRLRGNDKVSASVFSFSP